MYQRFFAIGAARNNSRRTLLNSPYCLVFLIAIILSGFTFKVQAQDFFPDQTDFGVRLGADYEIPGKNLKDDYKAGASFNAGFLWFHNNITLSGNFAYRQLSAKYGSQTYADPSQVTTVNISPYRTYLFYVSATYSLTLTRMIKAYGGLNLGAALSTTSYSQYTSYGSTYFSESGDGDERQVYIAPKIGFKIAVNNTWDIDLHANYNMLTSGGDYTYNSRNGTLGQSINLYASFAAGAGLIYKF